MPKSQPVAPKSPQALGRRPLLPHLQAAHPYHPLRAAGSTLLDPHPSGCRILAARFRLPQTSSLLSFLRQPRPQRDSTAPPIKASRPSSASLQPPSSYRKDSSGASRGSCPCPLNPPWVGGTHLCGREAGRN